MSDGPPEARAKRLRWRCRRGTRELDMMLARFVDRRLDSLDARGLDLLERLLAVQDPELSAWLTGAAEPGERDLAAFVEEVRATITAGDDGTAA